MSNNPKITDDEFQFVALAIEYWQEKEELINPSIDYVVDVPKLIQKLSDMTSNDSQFFYLFLEFHTPFHKTYFSRPQCETIQ